MGIESGPNTEQGIERREKLRDIAEEPELVVCQRAILAQVCGRRDLDPAADAAVLGRINETARPTENEGEYVLACGIAACDRVDAISIETGGVVRQLDGEGGCHETQVMLGKSVLESL